MEPKVVFSTFEYPEFIATALIFSVKDHLSPYTPFCIIACCSKTCVSKSQNGQLYFWLRNPSLNECVLSFPNF